MWAKTNATVASAAATSPDGTADADSLADNSTSGNHLVNYTSAISASTAYTFSAFLKQGTSQYGYVYISLSSGVSYGANINLATCAETNNYSTGGPSSPIYIIQPASNGWCRVAANYSSPASSPAASVSISVSNSAAPTVVSSLPSYAGTGQTIYIWDADLEANGWASSPIITSGATYARGADSLGTSSISWYNASAGSVYVRYRRNFGSGYFQFCCQPLHFATFTSGSYSDEIELGAAWNVMAWMIARVGSTQTAGVSSQYYGATTVTRLLGTYSTSKVSYSGNGTTVYKSTGTWSLPSTVSQFRIGMREGTTEPLQGWVQDVKYWNTQLSDVQIKEQSNRN